VKQAKNKRSLEQTQKNKTKQNKKRKKKRKKSKQTKQTKTNPQHIYIVTGVGLKDFIFLPKIVYKER
jgi:hypothetical protein